jgi:hypothetical protein
MGASFGHSTSLLTLGRPPSRAFVEGGRLEGWRPHRRSENRLNERSRLLPPFETRAVRAPQGEELDERPEVNAYNARKAPGSSGQKQ